ncbi:DeoR/GlpR family DNA-binding transcription regulator [Lactococcus nasutitermitis]|uniref:DeoR/GlpR family DNA-binding transcription regulator n=1 Tax=Lactococcus nasutitermitis TaxID=1652957 RepID=A0ABV9JCS7_9LACT|nr:DeoR/GlpR family DNA-binding transcription regulator [Lactococcus nasutitermitis]
MLVNERKLKIINLLMQQRRATLEELIEVTESSISTLRRDLNDLEEEKKLRRVHGGAELIQDLSKELSIFEKTSKNVHEKQIIANKALKKIKEGDVIFLDAGTTTGSMIAGIKQLKKELTIVTNSVTHASNLVAEHLTVYILGGCVKKTTDAITGSVALSQLKNYRFNLAFIGANAFVEESGVMTPDSEEAAIKRQAILQADEAFVLIDSSKIGQTSFVRFAQADEVIMITELEKK